MRLTRNSSKIRTKIINSTIEKKNLLADEKAFRCQTNLSRTLDNLQPLIDLIFHIFNIATCQCNILALSQHTALLTFGFCFSGCNCHQSTTKMSENRLAVFPSRMYVFFWIQLFNFHLSQTIVCAKYWDWLYMHVYLMTLQGFDHFERKDGSSSYWSRTS